MIRVPADSARRITIPALGWEHLAEASAAVTAVTFSYITTQCVFVFHWTGLDRLRTRHGSWVASGQADRDTCRQVFSLSFRWSGRGVLCSGSILKMHVFGSRTAVVAIELWMIMIMELDHDKINVIRVDASLESRTFPWPDVSSRDSFNLRKCIQIRKPLHYPLHVQFPPFRSSSFTRLQEKHTRGRLVRARASFSFLAKVKSNKK